MRNEDTRGVAYPGSEPSLSVVIPTRDRCELVTRLAERLLEDAGFCEVVVVDDGSTDGTNERLSMIAVRDNRLRLVPGNGSGPSAARALGALKARGEILLFLDDDVTPDHGLPSKHAARHSHDSDCVVVGYMPTSEPDQPGRETFATLLYAHEYEMRCEKYEKDPSRILRNLWMGNVSMPRDAYLDATVRWPEALPRGRHEDQHIGLRLLAMGFDAVFDRELRGTHQHHRTIRQFRRDCHRQGIGRAALETRYPDLVDAAGVGQYRQGLNRPLAAVVALSTRPRIGAVISSLLASTTRVLGAAGLFRAQTAAARLLRRIEQQNGFRSTSSLGGFATFPDRHDGLRSMPVDIAEWQRANAHPTARPSSAVAQYR